MSRRERQRRRSRNHGHPIKGIALGAIGLAMCATLIGALAAVGWVVAVADSAPNISDITPRDPKPLSQIYAADGSMLGYVHSDVVFERVAGPEIPQLMKEATIAIEDRRFYQHGALDYQGILRAGIKDVFGGHSLQGASTLTMQLVDNMYLAQTLRRSRSLRYKIVQAKLAQQLESKHSKNWILDTYLNDAPYGTVGGETARGIGAAAQIFFNRPVSRLDLAQTALLAGLPQAPSAYNPFISPQLARRRRHEVLVAMLRAGDVTRPQAVAADHSSLQVHSGSAYTAQARLPYIFRYALKQAEDRYGKQAVEAGGMKIYTTIDPRIEAIAQRTVDENGITNSAPGGTAAALSSVDPTTGKIVALAATEDYHQTKFFYPVQAARQTGSAAKVFAIMTLLHDFNGDPNSTYYVSRPLAKGWYPGAPDWQVHTDTNSYSGTINITKATAASDNTVFAQLVVDEGVSKFEATAKAMGLPADQMIGAPAEVLGGWKNGITTLQMAAADGVLANGGTYRAPTIIDHVTFADGHTDNWLKKTSTQVFNSGETYAATQVLKGVIQNGTGTAADYGCPAAGKTGTAENLANAWFVGYTPKLSTAVWVGYPRNNTSLGPNGFGGTMAAPLWHDFMRAASGGFCGDFPQPTTYFSGTQFSGPYSSGGSASSIVSQAESASGGQFGYQNGNGSASGNPYGGGNYSGGGTTHSGNPYSNSTLYAQPGGTGGGGTGTGGGTGGAGGTGGRAKKGGGGGTGGAGIGP